MCLDHLLVQHKVRQLRFATDLIQSGKIDPKGILLAYHPLTQTMISSLETNVHPLTLYASCRKVKLHFHMALQDSLINIEYSLAKIAEPLNNADSSLEIIQDSLDAIPCKKPFTYPPAYLPFLLCCLD